MKKFLITGALLLCGVVLTVAQTQSLGLRFGYPTSITYKKFLTDQNALEFMIGSTINRWNQGYYQRSFDKYNSFSPYRYISHEVKSEVYLQARYLLHTDLIIQGLDGNLSWYWGGGILLKTANVRYYYDDFNNGFIRSEKFDLDLGPEAIGGLEYEFDVLPIQVFTEVSLLIEIADRPLNMRFMGGGGIRIRI